MEQEFAVKMAHLARGNELLVGDADAMQLAFQVLLPEAQEFL